MDVGVAVVGGEEALKLEREGTLIPRVLSGHQTDNNTLSARL